MGILDNWLRTNYRAGDPINHLCVAEERNIINRFISELQGVGCVVQKNRDGRNCKIIVNGRSDTQPDEGYIPPWSYTGTSAAISGGSATVDGAVSFTADDHETNTDILDADQANNKIVAGIDGIYCVTLQGLITVQLWNAGPITTMSKCTVEIDGVPSQCVLSLDTASMIFNDSGRFRMRASASINTAIDAGDDITVEYDEAPITTDNAFSNGFLSVNLLVAT